jgi:uncharacterized protein YvpB
MNKYILEITADTTGKYSSEFQSTEILDDNLKFPVSKGTTYKINWYHASNGHYLVELTTPINGRFNWFFFSPHVKITTNGTTPNNSILLPVPYFSQRDNKIRPSQTCNISCCAMAIEYYYPGTANRYKPKQLEDILTEQAVSLWGSSSIYYHSYLVKILEKWGVRSNFSTVTSFCDIKKSLSDGNPVIYSGRFTPGGHIIVIVGYDDINRQWIVNDPWGEYFASGYTNYNTNGKQLRYSYNLISNVSYSGQEKGWAHILKKA